jgi:hypothetical protein
MASLARGSCGPFCAFADARRHFATIANGQNRAFARAARIFLYRSFGVSCYDKYLGPISPELATTQLSQIIKKKLTACAKGGMR